jgi:large exoprotein involved in heme utilization and adhesion
MHIANVLQMNMSSISTEANSGNGGAIHLDTGNYMNLMQSSITTTVKSSIGNGGDITVSTPALILDNGMVQANAVSGRGGDVFIDVKSLIGSQSQLIQGGDVPLEWKNTVPGFNIIQAASKFGLSGTVNVTSPQMDLSGVLIGLSTSSFGRDLLSQDYCAIGAGSSLTVRGYGILPPTASDLMY